MMLGMVIAYVGRTILSVDQNLPLEDVVLDPIKTHVSFF